MSIEALAEDLKTHEGHSQERYESLHKSIKKGVHKMSAEPVHIKNIFEPGHGAGMAGMLPLLAGGGLGGIGGGLGAGLLGGVLGGALLGGRGGLFGHDGGHGGGHHNHVTPTELTAALNGVTETLQNTTVIQTLGDIKAAIPLAEAQTQLAMAGQTASLTGLLAGVSKAICDSNDVTVAVGTSVKDAVTAYGTANLTATANAQYALATAIRDDGDKTRGLIVAINDTNLNRQLTDANNRITELLGDQRLRERTREVEVNVSQNVNQVQAQAQAQQQQQQQLGLLQQIAFGLSHVTQIAHATNQNIIAGNTGAVATGPQTANPTNVNTH